MEVQWYHYHSAFELSAAIDLAIFAIESIRKPAITAESGRWESLYAIVRPDHPRYLDFSVARRSFILIKRDIDNKLDRVRVFCIVLVAICSSVIVWATVYADESPEDPGLVWLVWAISISPAVIVFAINGEARSRVAESSVVRREIEDEVTQA
jgi:hypothetical protein